MNWSQLKDAVSHMYLAGAVVAFWYLIQDMAGSNPFTAMTNIFVTEFRKVNLKIKGKLKYNNYQSTNYYDCNRKTGTQVTFAVGMIYEAASAIPKIQVDTKLMNIQFFLK